MPLALVAYELIANSLAMSSYTTRAHGIVVKYINDVHLQNKGGHASPEHF